MKTKQLKLQIISVFLFVFGLFINASASNTCEKLYPESNRNTVQSISGPVRLKQGDKIWGYFTCQGCEIKYSAKPDYEQRQTCPGCGQPHQKSDKYEEPAMFRRQEGSDSVLYLVNPAELITNSNEKILANSGQEWSCPFCQSENFQTVHSCKGCGAELENPEKVFLGSAINLPNTQATNSTLLSKTDVQTQNSGWKALLAKKGAPILGVTALGLFIYGNQTFELPGEVVSATPTAVEIVVQQGNQNKILELQPGKVKNGSKWRIGETVRVYFKNFGGAKGVEKSNGTAYPVLIEKKQD